MLQYNCLVFYSFTKLHFVNWNHHKFKDTKSASEDDKNRGLCVLAVFVQV
jgi:hypothetical protein